MPRVACTGCGKTSQASEPWAREGSGFTALFEVLVLALCKELPVLQAARMLRCSDKCKRPAPSVALSISAAC